jgi:hypothetical protein
MAVRDIFIIIYTIFNFYDYIPYREYDLRHPDFDQEFEEIFKWGESLFFGILKGCYLRGWCSCKPFGSFTALFTLIGRRLQNK